MMIRNQRKQSLRIKTQTKMNIETNRGFNGMAMIIQKVQLVKVGQHLPVYHQKDLAEVDQDPVLDPNLRPGTMMTNKLTRTKTWKRA
jgi:hypothetical protein